MNDYTPTPRQYFIATIGFCNLQKQADIDHAKISRMVVDYVNGLTDKGSWLSVIERDPEGYKYDKKSDVIRGLRCNLDTYYSVMTDPFWETWVTKKQLANIEAVLEHNAAFANPTDTYFGGVGRSGGDLEPRDIPEGTKLSASTALGMWSMTGCGSILEVARHPGKSAPIEVRSEISSWKGISIGAEHYYAKFNLWNYRPSLKVVAVSSIERKEVKVGEFYGYGSWDANIQSRIAKLSSLKVMRPLSKADIKMTKSLGNPDRYESYKIGDWIDGFWTEEDAKAYAKKTYEKYFDTATVGHDAEE